MTEINLISHADRGFGKASNIEGPLRRIAWWSLGTVCIAGAVVMISFLFVRRNVALLETSRMGIVTEVNTQRVKEGLLLSLKERIVIASRALDAAKPWGTLFEVLGKLSDERALGFVSVDETGEVRVSFDLYSIEEALSVVTNTIALANNKRIRSARMQSLSLYDDGRIQLLLAFYPIF